MTRLSLTRMTHFKCALSIIALVVTVLYVMAPANAYAAGVSLKSCAPGLEEYRITQRVVSCIERAVIQAVFSMMGQMQAYMWPIFASLFTLAIAIMGIRVISGEKTGRSAMYAIRLAMVAYFMGNLGTFAGAAFAIESELISIVAGGSPWVMIDNFLGNLLGFGPKFALYQGIIGIVGAAVFSPQVASMLFMAGTSAVSTLLLFILNVVYTYLASIIMLGFLLVLSPIFLPWAVFFLTERYMKRLLDMIISIMLMPVLLFAFIQLFLGVFDYLIADIFDSVLPRNRDFRALWNLNNPVFSWLMPSDTSLMERLEGVAQFNQPGAFDAANPAVQTNVNPFLRHGFNAGSIANLPGLNFGPSEPIWVQAIAMKLIALWLFATLMKTMVSRIPEISSSIAGSVIGIPLSATTPQQMLQNVETSLRVGAGAIGGGGLGGEAGGAAAKALGGNNREQAMARQAGGVLGAMAGMMVTKRK